MTKISVIIPVYNSEKYLRKCLDSVLAQTFEDYEIIIVNDGSKDGSQKIIEEYTKNNPEKIKAFSQENGGQSSARNKALEYAEGEYISFVDSDDYLESNAYERAYSYAKDNDLDVLCFGFFEEKNETKNAMDYRMIDSEDKVISYVLNETSPCNKIIKRSIFTENNIRFTEKIIYEDLELIPQLALYTEKIDFINDRLYVYVIHQESTMRQKRYNSKMESIFSVMETLWQKFSNTKYIEELEFLYIEHLLHAATLRFLEFSAGDLQIKKFHRIIKNKFPNWKKNKYFANMGWKYKIICSLAYFKKIKILRILLGVSDE